jgi:fumarate hydratase class I
MSLLLAKKSLMQPIDIAELSARGPRTALEELRLEIYRRVNDLGLGAQGLGGLTTVLDVKVLDYPTHPASLPVAVIRRIAAVERPVSISRCSHTACSPGALPVDRRSPPAWLP